METGVKSTWLTSTLLFISVCQVYFSISESLGIFFLRGKNILLLFFPKSGMQYLHEYIPFVSEWLEMYCAKWPNCRKGGVTPLVWGSVNKRETLLGAVTNSSIRKYVFLSSFYCPTVHSYAFVCLYFQWEGEDRYILTLLSLYRQLWRTCILYWPRASPYIL